MLSIDYFKLYKTCVYSRASNFYGTKIETKDIEFLKYSGLKIINRSNLRNQSITYHLADILISDCVFYRGYDLLVSIEVLFSISIKKPVFSIKKISGVSKNDITKFTDILIKNEFSEHYITLIKNEFPQAFCGFNQVLKTGDLNE